MIACSFRWSVYLSLAVRKVGAGASHALHLFYIVPPARHKGQEYRLPAPCQRLEFQSIPCSSQLYTIDVDRPRAEAACSHAHVESIVGDGLQIHLTVYVSRSPWVGQLEEYGPLFERLLAESKVEFSGAKS